MQDDLSIPAFLLRKKAKKQLNSKPPQTELNKPMMEVDPEAARALAAMKMGTYHVRIFFQDEAPTLGCGWRNVTAKVGRKWVRVRDTMGRKARFTRNAFSALKPTVIT